MVFIEDQVASSLSSPPTGESGSPTVGPCLRGTPLPPRGGREFPISKELQPAMLRMA